LTAQSRASDRSTSETDASLDRRGQRNNWAPACASAPRWGYDVAGLTRSKKGAAHVADTGARALVADALNREQLAEVVGEQRPEAVVNLLTALPKRGPTRASHLKATNRLRTEGTANLLAAATLPVSAG
jgi:nucleoside-diphosphate-sugar epimerase